MSEQFLPLPERYASIENANERSWYFDPSVPRPFEAYYSIGAIKPSARLHGENALRQTLAGNMSPIYGPEDETKANMLRFYKSVGLSQSDLESSVVLFPQRQYDIPLQATDVDQDKDVVKAASEPLKLSERADMIYTHNPDTILAVRPADCPVVFASGATPTGEILTLTHIASGGAAAGFVEQMVERYDELAIDRDSLRLYVTPGAQAEHYIYENVNDPRTTTGKIHEGLIRDVQATKIAERVDGKVTGKLVDGYRYGYDTPNFVYTELMRLGLKPEQVYADISDTARPDSGFSSHSRAFNTSEERNIRDIMFAKLNPHA